MAWLIRPFYEVFAVCVFTVQAFATLLKLWRRTRPRVQLKNITHQFRRYVRLYCTMFMLLLVIINVCLCLHVLDIDQLRVSLFVIHQYGSII